MEVVKQGSDSRNSTVIMCKEHIANYVDRTNHHNGSCFLQTTWRVTGTFCIFPLRGETIKRMAVVHVFLDSDSTKQKFNVRYHETRGAICYLSVGCTIVSMNSCSTCFGMSLRPAERTTTLLSHIIVRVDTAILM